MYWNDDQSNWHESTKGNWCRKNAADEVLATAFRNSRGAWQIIINFEGVGRLVANEYFSEIAAAQDRAEDILDRASCQYLPPKLFAY